MLRFIIIGNNNKKVKYTNLRLKLNTSIVNKQHIVCISTWYETDMVTGFKDVLLNSVSFEKYHSLRFEKKEVIYLFHYSVSLFSLL